MVIRGYITKKGEKTMAKAKKMNVRFVLEQDGKMLSASQKVLKGLKDFRDELQDQVWARADKLEALGFVVQGVATVITDQIYQISYKKGDAWAVETVTLV